MTNITAITGMAAEESGPGLRSAFPGALYFGLLFAAALAVSMAYGVTLPVLPFVIERMVGADTQAIARHTGALTGLYTFALLFLAPAWGALSDRFDRRVVIVIGLLGSAATLMMLDAASTLAALYAARLLSGALSAAVLPAVLASVAETSPAQDRAHRFALIASATALGFLLGPAIGSWLSPMVLAPLAGMGIGGIWMPDSPFFLIALANLLPAILLLFPSPFDMASLRSQAAPASPTGADRSNLATGLLLTCIAVFGITVAEVGITLLGKQVLALDPGRIARFFMICGFVMIAVQVAVFPACARRLPLATLIALSMAVVTVGMALIPAGAPIARISLAFALVSAGTAVMIPALATMISEAAGALQGKSMGQQASVANLGQAVAAALTGILFNAAPRPPS